MLPPSSPPRTVSDLQSHLGFWMRFVSNHVSHAFARKLMGCGVTVAEWVVLRELYGNGSQSPSDLAERIGMTRGAASKLIERLEAKALVSRHGRSDDRRYQDIALTSAGEQLVPELASRADRNDEEFFSALSAEERSALRTILKKLVQAHGLHRLPTE